MRFSIVSVDRTRRLSLILVSYLTFVVFVALILPILSLLQHEHIIHLDWLIDNGRSMLPWATLVAFVFVIFFRKIYLACARIAAWVLEDSKGKARWTVIGFCLLIVTSYSWQLNIGIAHRGVPGWAYVGIPEFIQNDPPPNLAMPPEIARSVFDSALQHWVMPYIHKSGFASSEVLFLHFTDGSMRPANYQLAMVSWPKSTFKLEDGKLSHRSSVFSYSQTLFCTTSRRSRVFATN